MTHQDLDLTADVIDVRDIIARIEELEGARAALADVVEECKAANDYHNSEGERDAPEALDLKEAIKSLNEWDGLDESKELSMLLELMEEIKGYGGDEQWRGDWYPVTLIRETYFTDYIQELIHDCYEMPKEMHSGSWPYRHMTIDYEAAADEAKGDYMTVEIDGVDYFFR